MLSKRQSASALPDPNPPQPPNPPDPIPNPPVPPVPPQPPDPTPPQKLKDKDSMATEQIVRVRDGSSVLCTPPQGLHRLPQGKELLWRPKK